VSRVEPSWVDAATAYVSIDGHKNGDMRPYVYVTRDYGASWTSIASDLPAYGNVNTVRQDPVNPDLLYVGTEFGFFVSLDEGGSWHRFMPDLPVVRVDDVLVHPRDNDLVLATHGRSVMILDDVTPLQQLTSEVMAAEAHLFEPRDAVLWKGDITQSRSVTGDKNWVGEGAPYGTAVSFHLAQDPAGDVTLQVVDLGDRVVRDLEVEPQRGMNRVSWDLRANPEDEDDRFGPRVEPGVYGVRLTVGGETHTTTVRVLEDRWLAPL
jgi:hypothetical protein